MSDQNAKKMIEMPVLTKREIFALVAMNGLLSSMPEDVELMHELVAKTSFKLADEMIRESEKNVGI